MSKRLDALIADLQRQAMQAQGAGFESFEASGDFESVANFLVMKGHSRSNAQAMAREAMAKPAVLTAIKNEMGGQGLQGLGRVQTTGNMAGNDVAAQLKLTAKRDTASIGAPLPFALFGLLDSFNGYRRVLSGLLPTGVTLVSVEIGEGDGQPEAAVFTFNDGANTDTITVTCSTAPYPSVLQSTMTDIFELSQLRVKLSDKSKSDQFDQGVFPITRNMWGRQVSNNLTPADFFSPEQYQEGVIDVNVHLNIDKETMLQSKLIAVAGFSVSYSLSVRQFAAWRA